MVAIPGTLQRATGFWQEMGIVGVQRFRTLVDELELPKGGTLFEKACAFREPCVLGSRELKATFVMEFKGRVARPQTVWGLNVLPAPSGKQEAHARVACAP